MYLFIQECDFKRAKVSWLSNISHNSYDITVTGHSPHDQPVTHFNLSSVQTEKHEFREKAEKVFFFFLNPPSLWRTDQQLAAAAAGVYSLRGTAVHVFYWSNYTVVILCYFCQSTEFYQGGKT